MRVGFIGIGAMGLPMAKNVIEGGHEVVTTFHRHREPADELASMGAEIKETPAEIARETEVVITVLPADPQLKEVALGENGLIEGLSEGQVFIDMTTATALSLAEIEEEFSGMGVQVLDAPVSGGTSGAKDGTLTIIVGGKEEVLEEYRPLLETMGETIFYVGGVGQGKVVKMVNQMLCGVHILAIGEAFAFGVKNGADPEVLYDVIKKSAGYSKQMDLRLPGFLLDGEFEAGFKLDLMKKDINLAVESAKEMSLPIFFSSLASQIFASASKDGHGEDDFSLAAQYLADRLHADLSE